MDKPMMEALLPMKHTTPKEIKLVATHVHQLMNTIVSTAGDPMYNNPEFWLAKIDRARDVLDTVAANLVTEAAISRARRQQ